MQKIKNRKRYVKKQKADTSKDDELDLLGDEDVESFTGSQADLEGFAFREFCLNMLFTYLWVTYNIVKLQACSSLYS